MTEDKHNMEWSSIFDEFENQLKQTKKLILSELEGDTQQSGLIKVHNLMKVTEESKKNIEFENSVLAKIKETLNNSETPWEYDIQKIYNEKIESDRSQSQASRFSSQRYSDLEKIDEPSMTDDVPKTSYKDPWTKMPIENPVQSDTCKHFYERSVVFNILNKKKEFRCPYLGCVQIIKKNNIVVVDW